MIGLFFFLHLGNASITFFEIKCTGWLDEEDRNTKDDALDQNALLTYKVYQNSVRNGTRITSLLEESSKLLFSSPFQLHKHPTTKHVKYRWGTHVQSFDIEKKRISAVRCKHKIF